MWETLREIAKTIRVISESWPRTIRALVFVLALASGTALVVVSIVWTAGST